MSQFAMCGVKWVSIASVSIAFVGGLIGKEPLCRWSAYPGIGSWGVVGH